MGQDICIRYSGDASRSAFNVTGDGERCQVFILDKATGEQRTIFTGKEFSALRYAQEGGFEQEERDLRR